MIPLAWNETMQQAAEEAGRQALSLFRSRAIRLIEQVERALRGTKQVQEAEGVRMAINELERMD